MTEIPNDEQPEVAIFVFASLATDDIDMQAADSRP
jgi:hypothetical protein